MHKNRGEGSSQAFSHSLEPNPSRNHRDLEQGSWEALSLREGELLFEMNELGNEMTVGSEGASINTPTITHKMVGSDRLRSLRVGTRRFRVDQSRQEFNSATFFV